MGLWLASFRKSKLDHLDIVASCKHNCVLIHLLSVCGILSLKIFTPLTPGAGLILGGGYASPRRAFIVCWYKIWLLVRSIVRPHILRERTSTEKAESRPILVWVCLCRKRKKDVWGCMKQRRPIRGARLPITLQWFHSWAADQPLFPLNQS